MHQSIAEVTDPKPEWKVLDYASTASLYSVSHEKGSNEGPAPLNETEARISSLNAYDSSKAAFDALVGPLAENTCGLTPPTQSTIESSKKIRSKRNLRGIGAAFGQFIGMLPANDKDALSRLLTIPEVAKARSLMGYTR